MDFAVQRCCITPVFAKAYDISTDAILHEFDINFTDIKKFGCCGYPLKNANYKASIVAAARNLALAEQDNLNIVTVCNCCYAHLKTANIKIREDSALQDEINRSLKSEGLDYSGKVEVRHMIEVLYEDVGIDKIKQKIKKRFNDLKIAVHYGCHIQRPTSLFPDDEPSIAGMYDRIIELTGVNMIDWETQKQCCGSPMLGIDDKLSTDLMDKKLTDAGNKGAEGICVACAYCQVQFDKSRKIMLTQKNLNSGIPSILFQQMLGLSMGIDENKLGIHCNEISMDQILNRLC
jgi:heterodisulfide reductase subunit B